MLALLLFLFGPETVEFILAMTVMAGLAVGLVLYFVCVLPGIVLGTTPGYGPRWPR